MIGSNEVLTTEIEFRKAVLVRLERIEKILEIIRKRVEAKL